jgi:hypothetical protein
MFYIILLSVAAGIFAGVRNMYQPEPRLSPKVARRIREEYRKRGR